MKRSDLTGSRLAAVFLLGGVLLSDPILAIFTPVACVMTGGLATLGPGTTAHQAALTLARLGVRYLVVVDGEGRLLGAVSRDDLFGLQRRPSGRRGGCRRPWSWSSSSGCDGAVPVAGWPQSVSPRERPGGAGAAPPPSSSNDRARVVPGSPLAACHPTFDHRGPFATDEDA